MDPSPKSCHNHVESGIWHAGQTAFLRYLAQQHKHISKPGPDIGRRQKSQISSAVVTVASSLHLADHSLQGRGPAIIWHSASSPSGPVCQLLKTQFQVVLEQGGGLWQQDVLSLEHIAHVWPDLIFLQSFRAYWLLEKAILSYWIFPYSIYDLNFFPGSTYCTVHWIRVIQERIFNILLATELNWIVVCKEMYLDFKFVLFAQLFYPVCLILG